jgi:Tfp pilus assembly protein PilW
VPVKLSDETGTTLVELMVALMAGLVIFGALTTMVVTTMHGSARVTARVEATQRARIAMVRVMEQLHSACVTPEIAPVRTGSTGNSLKFVHQTGSAVSPTPILSVVSYASGTLTQSDYAATGGTSPSWTFASTPSSTRTLLTKVAPISPSTSIFSYYRYSNGAIASTPQSTPLTAEEAALTVEVRAGISADPLSKPVKDANVDANVRNSASLRLTPPSFNEGSPSKPCQ